MSITQRPVTEAALNEPSGTDPLWKTVRSWFIFGGQDHNIPAGSHRIMADRARARRTVEIAPASHAIGISRPTETSRTILEATRALTTLQA